MEGFVFKEALTTEFLRHFPYHCRYHSREDELVPSLKRTGILEPLFVTSSPLRQIVAGHRRFLAAEKAGISKLPVLEITGDSSPQRLFLLSIYSNWGQAWEDMDRAWTLKKASEDFHFCDKDIIELILPALGLPAKHHFLDYYQRAWRLAPELLDLIALGKIPFKALRGLGRFNGEDQRAFASLLKSGIALTATQVQQAGEWLFDLCRQARSPLVDFLKGSSLSRILATAKGDDHQRGTVLMEAIRRLRYPRLSHYEQEFETVARRLSEDPGELKIEPPPAFEGEGFFLRAHVKNREVLGRIIKRLKEGEDSLNSLFDRVL